MRRFSLLFLMVSVVSCQFFQSKEELVEKEVQERLEVVDWNEVDSYPLFESCDENTSKNIQKQCFQETMYSFFVAAFSNAEFEVENEINETLYVDFKIDEHGFITILQIEENLRINELIPGFNEEISNRLNDLTTVAPALKQGNPVSMKFRLPLALNTNN